MNREGSFNFPYLVHVSTPEVMFCTKAVLCTNQTVNNSAKNDVSG